VLCFFLRDPFYLNHRTENIPPVFSFLLDRGSYIHNSQIDLVFIISLYKFAFFQEYLLSDQSLQFSTLSEGLFINCKIDKNHITSKKKSTCLRQKKQYPNQDILKTKDFFSVRLSFFAGCESLWKHKHLKKGSSAHPLSREPSCFFSKNTKFGLKSFFKI
jgi:hypothetical protein